MNSKSSSTSNEHHVLDATVHTTEPEFSTISSEIQSKAFEIHCAINPLVSASAPLLMLTTQLREQLSAPDLNELHTSLRLEIKVFENKAHQLGYLSTTILAARYFLCALIDEIIFTAPWGKDSTWEQKNLLKTFQREKWGGERFFLILERHYNDTKTHLHLLELAYLCLSIGFEGKYRNHPRAYDKLGQFIDRLYLLIRNERGECSKQLFIDSNKTATPKKSLIRLPPVWFTVGITLAGLAFSFLPYYFHLNELAKPVKLHITEMRHPNE